VGLDRCSVSKGKKDSDEWSRGGPFIDWTSLPEKVSIERAEEKSLSDPLVTKKERLGEQNYG